MTEKNDQLRDVASTLFRGALKSAQAFGEIGIIVAEETDLTAEVTAYVNAHENVWAFSAKDLPKSPAAFWQGICDGIGDVEQTNRNKMVNFIRHLKKVGGDSLFIISEAHELSSTITGSLTNVSSLKINGLVLIGNGKLESRFKRSRVDYNILFIDNLNLRHEPASSRRLVTAH